MTNFVTMLLARVKRKAESWTELDTLPPPKSKKRKKEPLDVTTPIGRYENFT